MVRSRCFGADEACLVGDTGLVFVCTGPRLFLLTTFRGILLLGFLSLFLFEDVLEAFFCFGHYRRGGVSGSGGGT